MLIQSLHCHCKPVKEAKCTTCHIQDMHRECVYESICFPAWKPDWLVVVPCFLAKTCPCFWSRWSWWCPQPLLMTIQPQPCWQQLSCCMELMAANIYTLLCQRPWTWCSSWGLMAAPGTWKLLLLPWAGGTRVKRPEGTQRKMNCCSWVHLRMKPSKVTFLTFLCAYSQTSRCINYVISQCHPASLIDICTWNSNLKV